MATFACTKKKIKILLQYYENEVDLCSPVSECNAVECLNFYFWLLTVSASANHATFIVIQKRKAVIPVALDK